MGGGNLKPRLSVSDFVLQLWRKVNFPPKLRSKIWNGKKWVQSQGRGSKVEWVTESLIQRLGERASKVERKDLAIRKEK